LLALEASAQPITPLAGDDERPWAAGVAGAQQSQALAAFEQGNALFAESQYRPALAKYRDAIAAWAHPAIDYNMAVTLIHLDRPLEAYESLQRATRFGAAPLGNETYDQALTYRKLLDGQLAELRVVCAEPGDEVMLDGEKIFQPPSEVVRRLLPGSHQLVASKPRHVTATRALILLPGKLTVEILRLVPIEATIPRRRWSWWKPWLVLTAGAIVGAVGAPLLVAAKREYERYDASVAALCPRGCPTADLLPWITDQKRHAELENALAITSFAVGGALAASGLTLIILNQPRLLERPSASRVALLPEIGPRVVALSAKVLF
jgi:hypothetical protein